MTIRNWKFSYKLLALIFVDDHVFFNGTADKQIIFNNFFILISCHDFVIICDTVV
jgi:hypothetical protein